MRGILCTLVSLFRLNNNGGGQILKHCPYLVIAGKDTRNVTLGHGTHWATHSARGNLVTAGPAGTPAKPAQPWSPAQPAPRQSPPSPGAQPSPGRAWPATDRGNLLRFAGSSFAKLSSHPILLSRPISRSSPTHAFMQRHAKITSWWSPYSQPLSRPRAVRFVSHSWILWAHNSRHRLVLGTFLPVNCPHDLMDIWNIMSKSALPSFCEAQQSMA